MAKKKRYMINRVVGLIPFIIVFVLPFVVIPLSTPRWMGQLLCAALDLTILGLWCVWIALNPTESIITEDAKLAQPGRERPRRYFEIIFRILLGILGISILAGVAPGFVRDYTNLIVRHHQPQVVDGTIRTINRSWRTGGVFQYVSVVSDSGEPRRLVFCLGGQRVKEGARYRFTVAPHSGMILMVEEPPPLPNQPRSVD
jgi:hypothetical protein